MPTTAPTTGPTQLAVNKSTSARDERKQMLVYVSAQTAHDRLHETVQALHYYAAGLPQARARIVCIEPGPTLTVIIEVRMGTMRAALRGRSIRARAGFALIHQIMKELFVTRPVLTGPPAITTESIELGAGNGQSNVCA